MNATQMQIDRAMSEFASEEEVEVEPPCPPQKNISSLNLHLASTLNEDHQKDVDKTNQIVQQGINGKKEYPEIPSPLTPENHDSETAPEPAHDVESGEDDVEDEPAEKPEEPKNAGEKLIDFPSWLKS
jgi:hypothetical protein